MLSVDVCSLPATGGSSFVLVAGLLLLTAGLIVTRWVRASAGRMSVVVAPLALLSVLVFAPSVNDPCATAPATTSAPTTTVFVGDPNLVLEIDTTSVEPFETDSVSAADADIVFELGLFGDVHVHINWGDGSTDDVNAAGPFPHTYATSGKYTITVSGSLTGFGQDPLTSGDPLLGASFLKSVRSFGELGITSLNLAFYGSANLIDVPSTLPATVIDVRGMFVGASSFNGDVSGWDTGQMTSMRAMFAGASSFNQSLNSWDTGLVTDMSNMFEGAMAFNGDVSGWDTGLVTNMEGMFTRAFSFNQSLDSWDTGSVTNMEGMFFFASSFNQSLNSWDTGSVTNMFAMFYLASSFNQSLDSWDAGSVTNMNGMFYFASSFNQSLGAWDISEVVSMNSMLDNSALSVDNYDATLNGWADIQQAKQPNVVLGAAGLFFSSNGASAHDTLTNPCVPNPSNWQINDAGLDSNSLINNDQFFAVGC